MWSHLGNTYYAQRKYPEAMDLYRKALAIEPEAPHALYSMGVAFADAGMFREAVNYWLRVSKAEPRVGTRDERCLKMLNCYRSISSPDLVSVLYLLEWNRQCI